MPDKRKSKMVEFSSETVIFDEKGNRVIACPTEQEAVNMSGSRNRKLTEKGVNIMSVISRGESPGVT